MSYFNEDDMKKITDTRNQRASAKKSEKDLEKEIIDAMLYALDCYIDCYREVPGMAAQAGLSKDSKIDEWRRLDIPVNVKNKTKSKLFRPVYETGYVRVYFQLGTNGKIMRYVSFARANSFDRVELCDEAFERTYRKGITAVTTEEFRSELSDLIRAFDFAPYRDRDPSEHTFFYKWALLCCNGRKHGDDEHFEISGPLEKSKIEKNIKDYWMKQVLHPPYYNVLMKKREEKEMLAKDLAGKLIL